MHNGRGFDRMGPSDPPAIALQMAARTSVMLSVTAHPPRDPRLWARATANKNGVSNARPHHASLERSGRLFLFRGHRLVLRLNRLAFFEGDDLLRARTELRIVFHGIRTRQFVD